MRISDWSSDVCSSDLFHRGDARQRAVGEVGLHLRLAQARLVAGYAGGAAERIAGVAGGLLEMVAALAEIALEVVGVGGIHRGNSGGGRTVLAILAASGLARLEGRLNASAATLGRRHVGYASPAPAARPRPWSGSGEG